MNELWPRRGVATRATATLEQIQNGFFVAVDFSSASTWSASGGEVLLSAPWSFTLGAGQYRVRVDHEIFDHALTSPVASALSNWTLSDRYSSSWTSDEFTCAPNRPALTISVPASTSIGSAAVIQPGVAFSAGWPGELRFALISAPPMMTIDAITGELAWTPGSGDAGRRSVIVALESDGAVIDVMSFELHVTGP